MIHRLNTLEKSYFQKINFCLCKNLIFLYVLNCFDKLILKIIFKKKKIILIYFNIKNILKIKKIFTQTLSATWCKLYKVVTFSKYSWCTLLKEREGHGYTSVCTFSFPLSWKYRSQWISLSRLNEWWIHKFLPFAVYAFRAFFS
jgi:hypothetical protein